MACDILAKLYSFAVQKWPFVGTQKETGGSKVPSVFEAGRKRVCRLGRGSVG